VRLPLKIESTPNRREHWAARASRAKLHRTTAWASLREADKLPRILGPVVVTITRIAPRELDDDNLAAGAKAVRDGVADWLGVDDRDPLITWRYAQERGKPKEYAARIEVQTVKHDTQQDSP
jgi:hypothetical protein